MALWTCPKCKRKFRKNNQMHSCRAYPLANHFKGKEEVAKPLFAYLKVKIEEDIGNIKVVSLECCIHLETPSALAFAAVYALRDRIRIHLTSDHELKNPRIGKFTKMSKSRYLYSIDIKDKDDVDEELLSWLSQAYNYLKMNHGQGVFPYPNEAWPPRSCR